jgi:acetyltransferase-like isoleucine patch superfamily enzyme
MPIASDVRLGKDVLIHYPDLVNLYGCELGDETKVGPFVEIQKGARIGCRCKISSHTFICEGVTIEDEVFVGHGVMFINDRRPIATPENWNLEPTFVGRGASIGTGAIIMCGVRIGAGALIGSGAVVTHDVLAGATVVGVPARLMR